MVSCLKTDSACKLQVHILHELYWLPDSWHNVLPSMFCLQTHDNSHFYERSKSHLFDCFLYQLLKCCNRHNKLRTLECMKCWTMGISLSGSRCIPTNETTFNHCKATIVRAIYTKDPEYWLSNIINKLLNYYLMVTLDSLHSIFLCLMLRHTNFAKKEHNS